MRALAGAAHAGGQDMESAIEHEALDAALRTVGSSWDIAQAHGLLCSRLAVEGVSSGVAWIDEVLEGTPQDHPQRRDCEALLDTLYDRSYRQLAERRSEFELLLPDDGAPAALRAAALAHWCEGYLHGLVGSRENPPLRKRLAEEPIAGLIKDLLQITRASADGADDETNEAAYAEIVEYVRVGAQLVFEELAPYRTPLGAAGNAPGAALH